MAAPKFFLAFFLTLTLISVLPLLTFSFSSDHPTDRQILVLLDDLSLKSSHSLFFNALTSRGFSLDFKLADDPSVSVKRYGEYLYDGLILFSPSTDRFGGSLDLEGILDFVDSGHDLILAADSKASDLIRNIAAECGVDFDEDPSAVVVDHTGYAVSETEGDHTLIASDTFIQSNVILGSRKIEAPVLFEGLGHSLNPANSLVLKVLSASPSAYSASPTAMFLNPPSLTGIAISLVSVVQARNNARIMISGSLSMFSNRLFRSGVQKSGTLDKYEKSGNEQFVTELSKWVFHERGHLKALNLKHNKAGETEEPAEYRINDDLVMTRFSIKNNKRMKDPSHLISLVKTLVEIEQCCSFIILSLQEFSVELFEWSGTSWIPYIANDVQVQFYMMSPYVLKTLSTNNKGLYYTSFKVPDVYGVFQFKVEYQRLGYTTLSLSKQIPVRPFKHNEYERFITTAYPYYGASFATMAGFFIFSFVYLYNK